MNPCPKCGAFSEVSEKPCDACGGPAERGVAYAGGGFGQPPGFGGPPGYGGGGPAPLRCQMGHDIAPGASYCAHGHPIALDAMPFANDPYGAPQQQQGYGAPQQGGFGAPPQQGYGAPQQGYGGGYPQQGGFGAPPPQQQYGGQPGYPDPNAGFAQQPQYGGFDPSGQTPYGTPAQQFGQPAPQQVAAPPEQPLPPHALRGFLVSYQSNSTGDFWPLHGGRKTVGRANSGENVDISLSDATISSRHAAVTVDGVTGSIAVEDTGSTNGTYVNEEHIGFNGRRELRDGDKVRFGGYSTVVKIVNR